MTQKLHATPLNTWHRDHGARMVDFGGWDMPVQYETGILSEHLATRRYGGLFDISHMGRFLIKGPQRVAFLQHVLSNNAEALAPWQAQYTMLPNPNGSLIDDAYLYRFGTDEYLLVVNASNRTADWTHLQTEARSFPEVVIEDHSEAVAMIAFQGPLSARVIEPLFEAGHLPDTPRNCLSAARLCGADVLIGRTGYTGEPVGFELFMPADAAERVWTALYESGHDQGIVPVGLGARDTLRLEAGMPLYGHEFGADPDGCEIPAFAFPLTRFAVSFSDAKGDFIGRAALARQSRHVDELRTGSDAPNDVLRRRIRRVALLDRGVARQGDEVYVGARKVGVVTSGTTVPYWIITGTDENPHMTEETGRRSLAFAYVDAELGMQEDLRIAVRKRNLQARFVRSHGSSKYPPFFRPMRIG